MSDPELIDTDITLDFEQRARAVALENDVSNDEYATACELIYLRDKCLRNEQIAQLRDLLRCVAWIRDLQLSSTPNNFDLRELFGDINRTYLAHQLLTATNLYAQLDDYCKANSIPATVWKME